MWNQQGAGALFRVASVTRPKVILGIIDDSCPHRIQFDVPIAREDVPLARSEARAISSFPQGTRSSVNAVYVLSVVLIEPLHEKGAGARLRWRQEQVYMVRHQAERMNCAS